MIELLTRERNERMAHWEMLLSGFGAFLGHNAEMVKRTLRPLRKALAEEVFHEGYSIEKLSEYLRGRLKEATDRRRTLEHLTNMTVA